MARRGAETVGNRQPSGSLCECGIRPFRPVAVIKTSRDGSYAWRCEDCGKRRFELAHRGPRKSVCKACQNKRYRRSGGDALKERNRKRMQLRRRDPGPTLSESSQPAAERRQ